MRFYDLTYIVHNDKPIIFSISKDEYLKIIEENFLPYFYTEVKDDILSILEKFKKEGKIKSYYIKKVNKNKVIKVNDKNTEFYKVTVNTPTIISSIRKELEEKGIRTYESNIPFTSRFIIDKIDKIEKHQNKYLFLDIEVISPNGLKDYKNGKIITIAVSDGRDYYLFSTREKKEKYEEKTYEYDGYKIENVKIIRSKSELEMLLKFIDFVLQEDYTHFVAWNSLFDWNWIVNKIILYKNSKDSLRFLTPIFLSPILLKGFISEDIIFKFFKKDTKLSIKREFFRGIIPVDYEKYYKIFQKMKEKTKKPDFELLVDILRKIFYRGKLDFNKLYEIEIENSEFITINEIDNKSDFIIALNIVYSKIINFLENKFMRLRDDIPWKGQKTVINKEEFYDIFGMVLVDLKEVYRKLNLKEEISYALDYIAKKVVGFGKSIEFDSEMWETDPEEIEKYNINDVFLMVKINEKMNALESFEELKTETFIENINKVFSQTAMINNFFMKNTKHLNIIFPYRTFYKTLVNLKSNKVDFLLKKFEGIIKDDDSIFVEPETIKQIINFFKNNKSNIPLAINERKVKEIVNKRGYLKDSILTTFKDEKEFYRKSVYVKFSIDDGRSIDAILKIKPSKMELEKDNPVPGGYVRNIKKGLYDTVAVFDFASLYPNLIITFNISPETLLDYNNIEVLRELEEIDLIGEIADKLRRNNIINEEMIEWFIETVKFRGNIKMSNYEGVIPHFVKKLIQKRYHYKKLEKEMKKKYEETNDEKYLELSKQYHIKNWSYKILINAIYGWQGYKSSMVYHPILASLVTTFGRLTDLWLIKKLKEIGYNPIYADTDSIFIPLKNKFNGKNYDELLVEIDSLNDYFKNLLDEWVYSFVPKKRFILKDGEYKYTLEDFKHTMEFEFEYLIYKIVFHQKKTYYYREIDLENKKLGESINIKGLDVKRSDRSLLQKFAQEKIMKYFMDIEKFDIRNFIRDMVNIANIGYSSQRLLSKYFTLESNNVFFNWLKIVSTPQKISKTAEEYKGDNSVPKMVIRFYNQIYKTEIPIGSKVFVIKTKEDIRNLIGLRITDKNKKLDIIAFRNENEVRKLIKEISFNKLLFSIDKNNILDSLKETILRTLPSDEIVKDWIRKKNIDTRQTTLIRFK